MRKAIRERSDSDQKSSEEKKGKKQKHPRPRSLKRSEDGSPKFLQATMRSQGVKETEETKLSRENSNEPSMITDLAPGQVDAVEQGSDGGIFGSDASPEINKEFHVRPTPQKGK